MATDDIKHTDILLDENNDVIISDGDILVGDSLEQEGALIMRYHPGTLRRDPLCGVGLSDWINADVDAGGIALLEARIRQQFARDGKQVNDISYTIEDGGLLDVAVDFDQQD